MASSDLPLRADATASFGTVEAERQKRLLRRFAPVLRPVLRPSERVLFATPAHRKASLADLVTRGVILAGQSKACVIVFTTERLFLFPTRSDHLPGDAMSHVEYGSVVRMTVSGMLSKKLAIAYLDGSRETIRLDFDEVADSFAAAVPDLLPNAKRTDETSRRFLCPNCRRAIPKREFECSECGTRFKSRDEAIRRSLVFPGGGYFYTREYFYGILDAVVESLLLIYFSILVLGAVRNGFPLRDLGAIAGIAVLLALEKWVSVQHALGKVESYMIES